MSSRTNLKKGSAHVKRTSIVAYVLRHKTKDIIVHPSMLTYFNNEPETDGQRKLVIDRPKHHKYDFLLAPLGLTEIVQIEEDLLLLISKRRKVLDKSTGEVKHLNVPVVYQEMTLKFASREDRDNWMEVIIAECNKVYLEGLIETSQYFRGKFVEAAHNEIWTHILLCDETLRRAYIAPAESDQWKLVNIVLIVVIEWLQALLGVRYLVPVHKKVFVELFTLMLQDPAARALFILVRPKEGFRQDFKLDRAAGDYASDKSTDTDPKVIEAKNNVAATKSFIREIKDRVQSSTWKQYRSFLAIINHPAMPSTAESSSAGEADLRSSGWGLAALMSSKKHSSHTTPLDTCFADELAWCLGRIRSPTSEFTWEMMKNAVSDTPYLTYRFIKMEIEDKIDDERVRKVLLLLERVPPQQRNQTFEADSVAKRERPHFCALVEYFKFREVWKVFHENHMQCTPFFEAVHNLIWSRITSTDDPMLRSIFLHTTVTAGPGAASFADVLNIEMVINNINDIQYLRRLDIHVGTDNTPRAHVGSSHCRSTVYFRKLAMDRLLLWVKRIVGTAELDPSHAPYFVKLLVAAAKSAVVRAVLWLILPAPGAFQEGADATPGGIPVVVEQFIESLLTLAKPASRLERFLSFLFVAEHPLKDAVRTASPQRAVSPPNIAVGVDTYAVTMTWADEIVWMDQYPQQTWSLSWGELNLLRNDTPYFSLQVLLRRVHQETNTSLHWLELITSMPKDIVSARFEADVNMSAVNGIHQFGARLKHTAAHFLTFVDSRRVVELWRLFETPYLNSNPAFVEEAQSRLLFVLNHQRESPGNNETNWSGFSEMMVLLDMATTGDDASFEDVTFHTLIPMSVVGDKMWRKLQSLFRPDGKNTASVASITAIGALKPKQNLTAFKKFMDHIAQLSAAFFGSDAPGGNSGGAFADLLIACLDNAVLRAVFMIVKPRRTSAANSRVHALDTTATSQRLKDMLDSLNQQKGDCHLLYLLLQLGYKGIKKEEDGSLSITELSWAVESEWWLLITQHSLTLVFDSIDFALLADPVYLLFRFVSKNFQTIGEWDTYGLVNQVQQNLPEAVNHDFCAHDNYLPCKEIQRVREGEAVKGPHFKYLLYYPLYNEMWKVVMSPPEGPSMDYKFAQAVMYATWLLVKSNANPDLSRMLLPLETDLKWEELTYLIAVQRFAIISVKRRGNFELSTLYPTLVIADNLTVSPDCISAHTLLVNRIIKWVLLLGGYKHHMEETDADLFMELFAASAADVAMRAFLVTVEPDPSVVNDFKNSASYTQDVPLTVGESQATTLCSASIMCVKLLAQTFLDKGWQQFRSFLTVLNHPLRNAGTSHEIEPLWEEESKWIQERFLIEPVMVSWQELEYVMTETPYIFLLLVTKALPTAGQQKAAMLAMPPNYLHDKFEANRSRLSDKVICAPHFIVMCLHEATRECALEVFQEQRMINDGFFEALLREAVLDSNFPLLLLAFRLLQRFLYENDKCVDWNIDMLRCIPNISSVLIKFLWDISHRENFRRDEKIIGNLVLLVFQLESCSSDSAFTQAIVPASKLMRRGTDITKKFFEMLGALNIPKWFSRLCWNFNVHFGQPAQEPVLAMNEIYATEQNGTTPVDALPFAKQENISGDVMLDDTIPLTKHKLTMSILGFFNLGLEFNPEVLCEFISGLGSGRPFFSFFLHQSESLRAHVLLSASSILGIKMGTLLYTRMQERFLFYDNDHLTPDAVETLGLQTSTTTSVCSNLSPSEFADLVTVAMYMHDLHNLKARLETVAVAMIADQERRNMVMKFMKWMLEYFVTPDVKRENHPRSTKTNERCKWKHCEKFKTVSFEEVIECSAEATIASHLLRGAARSSSYVTLERLFQHYIRNSHPTLWKKLFQGSKTIAYFIKYVDVEDLNLAFSKFFDMNPGNYCFMHHLLKVRKMLTVPIVSAQDLIALTASSSSFDDNNADRFFDELRMKGKRLPADQGDLKMVYFLTASWMKISKEKVLFPLPPRNAQIITLLTVASWAKSLLKKNDKRMGKALIAQVGTGEGKSLIIAMMAIYFVKVLGKRVHILENNQGLLDKDVETMKPLFAEFGILTKHEGDTTEDKPTLTWTSTEMQNQHDSRREFCKGKVGVTYCLRRNLERSFQESIMAEDYKPLANTVLIVDEVDDLIVDEHPNQPYATKDIDQARFQRACTEAQVEIERAAQAGEDFVISDFANDDFAYETAAYAYQRSKSMVLNKDYAVVGEKYVMLRDGKPIEVYDYALECLKFIKRGVAPTFNSTYYVQSVPYLLSQYDCITGFSGSLGSVSERGFLAQQYKAWSFDTPSFLDTCTNVYKTPPVLMDDPLYPGVPCVHVYDTENLQADKIVEMCLRLHMKVPVLVIAKSAEEAIAIETKVKAVLAERRIGLYPNGSRNKYVQLFRQYKMNSMTLDRENWGHIVSRATSKGPEEDRFCITITDPFGGRGHDFDVHDDEVNRLGGMAVIMTSIPASDRVWRQWKGRTARKDNRGQYAVVLCANCSPISSMKEFLVDYSLKDTNAAAITNLYEERLVEKLLSVQDDQQREKLSSKEEEIVTGKRVNRLCDLFYKAYGSMKEGKWPSCKEHVELRALLADTPYGTNALNSAYSTFQLEEYDAASADFAPPNMHNTALWTAKDAADWIASNVVSGEEREDAEPTDVSVPLPPTSAQQWHLNPQRSDARRESKVVQGYLSGIKPMKRDLNYSTGPVRSQKKGLPPATENNVLDQEAMFSQEKGPPPATENNVLDQEAIFSQEKGPPPAAKNNVADDRRVSKVVQGYLTDDTCLGRSNILDSTIDSDFNYNEQDELLSMDNTNEQPAPQMLPPAPLPRNVEFSEDLDRLIIMEESTLFLPPPPTEARRSTAPRIETERKVRPPVVAVPVLPPSPPDAPSHTVAVNPTDGSAIQLSTIVAASGTGSTESSGSVAMSLVEGIRFATEVRELKELCVGDTNRLTNQMDAALKDRMYLYEIKSNDPLTVAVTDSAGNGVAGLAVSGAITKARNEYTMIFRTNVTPEEYQYNFLLYGRKKVEVYCKGIQLLSAQGVLIKPAPKLRPPAAFAFYNAADNTRVPAGGTVLISSRDDPRFTLARPLFTAISIPYKGADISLPCNLPDCVITVAPDISGYNNEYSEKFILFGNETIPGEVKRMMLSKNNLVEGEWRVVLSWGKHPLDLDLYCITNFQPRKVYFGMKNGGGQKDPTMGSIELDIDVRQGFGPETITLTPNPTKKYRFIVHNFTGNKVKSLVNSGGKIVVNKSRGPPVQFEVPTDIILRDDGEIAMFWHVFDLIEGVLVPINKVTKVDLRDVEVTFFAELEDLCSRYSDYINVDLTGFGYRPIQYASAYNNIAAVEHLIEKGAAVDKANAWGYRPIHCVSKGHFRSTMLAPHSWYSFLDTHSSWKLPNEPTIEPPNHGLRARSAAVFPTDRSLGRTELIFKRGQDDLNAIVADIGSFSTRIGHAGEDAPKAYIHTAVGVLDSSISSSSSTTKLGTSTSSSSSKPTKQPHHYKYDLFRFYENMPVESPVRDGLIVNWDMLEDLWEHCLISYLRLNHNVSPLNLSEFPLLFAEKPYTPASTRYRLCEMMFEQYNAPAIFFSKDAVLSCYACGKTGGLVVDIGGSGTVVTPVQDGWVEQKGVCRSLVGGRMIDAQVRRIIKQASLTPFFRLDRTAVNNIDLSDGRTIQATFKQNLGRVHPSYDAYKRLEVARDLKETLCRMSDSTLMEGDSRYCSIPLVPYELPDGTKVEVNIERYQMGELLIDPSTIDQLYNQDLETLYPQLPTSITVPGTLEGVPKIMSDAVARCDHDMQAMLLKDIVLTGGSSSIDGLQDRIRTELEKILYAGGLYGYRLKINSVGTTERSVGNTAADRALSPWLGGSIVGSLGSFHELWVSRKEYQECGASIVDRKCP